MQPLPTHFVDAILAAPDDDTARLACADWLDEHGDPEWAELIRVQCAARAPGSAFWPAGRWGEVNVRTGELARVVGGRTPGLEISFERGFPDRAYIAGTLTADTLRAAAGLPFLLSLDDISLGDPSGLPAADLHLLGSIRGLEAAHIAVADEPTWEHLEPLVGVPRLERLHVRSPAAAGLSESLQRRWHAARAARAAGLSPAAALETARRLFGQQQVFPVAGGLGVVVQSSWPGWAERLAALRGVRALLVRSGELPRGLPGWDGLHSLTLQINREHAGRPEDWSRLTELREVDWFGENGWGDWANAVECLARLPRLEALRLVGRDAPPASALCRLTGLRVLHVGGMRRAADARELAWPELIEFVAPRSAGKAVEALDPGRFPRLRLAHFGRPESPRAGAALAAHGVTWRFEAEGLSLTLPGWFAEVPAPPPDPRTPEAVPLAAWREWGTGGGDELMTFAPTRVVLERVGGPASAPEGSTPHSPFADAPGFAEARTPTQTGHVAGVSVRQLWRGRDRAYRLAWEASTARVPPPAELATAVGRTLRWES